MQNIDPERLALDLAERGYATRPLIPAEACSALAALYDRDDRFRKRIVMEQRAYGRGEYKYFAYPLPDAVAALRAALYPPLAQVANAWRRASGEAETFPATLEAYLDRCHAAGQTRQGNRVNFLSFDDFHQEIIIPGGDFPSEP